VCSRVRKANVRQRQGRKKEIRKKGECQASQVYSGGQFGKKRKTTGEGDTKRVKTTRVRNGMATEV